MNGLLDDDRALTAAQSDADLLKRLIFERTGLMPSELQCPREKSDMTPCVARDGGLAVTMSGCSGICVGCERAVADLLNKEKERGA